MHLFERWCCPARDDKIVVLAEAVSECLGGTWVAVARVYAAHHGPCLLLCGDVVSKRDTMAWCLLSDFLRRSMPHQVRPDPQGGARSPQFSRDCVVARCIQVRPTTAEDFARIGKEFTIHRGGSSSKKHKALSGEDVRTILFDGRNQDESSSALGWLPELQGRVRCEFFTLNF